MVKEETLQGWESVFDKYESLQRGIFSYLSGFTDLRISVPGVPVRETKKSLRDIMKELKQMQKELSKFPVIAGLDEPSMRSTSEMSELAQ